MGASAAITLIGGMYSSSSQRRTGRINQRFANLNAEFAEMQAEDAIERGKEDEQTFRKQVKGVIGSQRASYGASGVDVNRDSALDVQASTAVIGEQDALTIRSNALREAFGYRINAIDYRTGGTMGRLNANESANATLLTSLGQSAYYAR